MTVMRTFGPFNAELRRAVVDNLAKLEETGRLERHLAVFTDRFDVLLDPYETPPPPIPAGLDCLWVVPRWRHGEAWLGLWVARSGDRAWRVYAAEGP
jgi:hypothetical protein